MDAISSIRGNEVFEEWLDSYNFRLNQRLNSPEAVKSFVRLRFGTVFLEPLLRRVACETEDGHTSLHSTIRDNFREEMGDSPDFEKVPHQKGRDGLGELLDLEVRDRTDELIQYLIANENLPLLLGMLQYLERSIPVEFTKLYESLQRHFPEKIDRRRKGIRHLENHIEHDVDHSADLAKALLPVRSTWTNEDHNSFLEGAEAVKDFHDRLLAQL